MSIVQAATDLCKAVDGGAWRPDAVKLAKSALSAEASPDAIAEAMRVLLARLQRAKVEDADGVAHVAISAGALVERGAAPGPLADVLMGIMPAVLEAAERFARACVAGLAPLGDDEDEPADAIAYFEDRAIPKPVFEAHASRDPSGAAAFARLEEWTLPLVAALSRSHNHHIKAQGNDALVKAAFAMAGSQAHWLAVILDAELDQTWYVIDSRSNRGFAVTLNGVVSNFDLHSLLAALLVPLGIEGEAPSPEIVAFLEGKASAPAVDTVSGTWNLYDVRAASHDLTEPGNVPMDQWVWPEGRPRDVVRASGHRLVIIGAAPYARSWSLARTFGALPQSIRLIRELTDREIGDLLGV